MQLALILAVLASLLISENSPPQPVSGMMVRLAAAACGMAVVPLLAAVCSGMIARQLRCDSQPRHLLLRQFSTLRRVHVALWLAVAMGIAYWLDWGQVVRFNWHLDRAFLIDDVLILMPVLLPLLLSWNAFYEVDRAAHTAAVGEASSKSRAWSRRKYLTIHVRHHLGILLLPVLLLLAVADAAELIAPGLLQDGWAALFYVPPLLLMLAMFPLLLRHGWETAPLRAGPLRQRLQNRARQAGFSVREILVWHTQGLMANAAVAGVLPLLRYVFLTDGLLSTLNDEEIEAVFAHEVGHVHHRHVLLRMIVMLAPLSVWFLAGQTFPGPVEDLQLWLVSAGPGVQVRMALVALAAMAVYVLVVFGFYSKLLEHQADLFGCCHPGSGPTNHSTETFISALKKLASATGRGRDAPSWQHASINRRIAFLNRLSGDPNGQLRFQRRVRLLGALLIGIVISPLAYRLFFA